MLLRDVDGLALMPVGEAQQPFARAVDRLEGARDLGPANDVARGEARAKTLRQGGHDGEICGAAVIDPMQELARAKRRLADISHLADELLAAQPDAILARVGRRPPV